MAHHCRALVLHCIDFRLQPALADFLRKQRLEGDADVLSLAGGVQSLVTSATPKSTELFRNIVVSCNLHVVRELLFINHTDCGAYGGRAAFVNDKEELQKHQTDLHAAARIIRQHFPDVTTRLFIARVDALAGTTRISIVPVANE